MVDQTRIATNFASSYGGGAYIDRHGWFRRCLIYDNGCAGEGGGVYMSKGGELQYCTIVSNEASAYGGGVSCLSNTLVSHCIIYYNHDSTIHGDYDNTETGQIYTNNCMSPLVPGNITNDPGFVSLGGHDYHLLSASPCIDAGLSNNPVIPDFQDAPRPLDGNGDHIIASDIGCYEFISSIADTDGDGLSDAEEWTNYLTSPVLLDTDGDNVSDSNELAVGTNPLCEDSDHDGLSDNQELFSTVLDPLDEDSDGDGLPDGYEFDNPTLWTSQPGISDTDGDGLSDGWEHIYQTDPENSDYDNDGVDDGDERIAGTDPQSSSDYFYVEQILFANGLTLGWYAHTNRSYRMERTTNLNSHCVWESPSSQRLVHGKNQNVMITNQLEDISAFYRIRVEYPR